VGDFKKIIVHVNFKLLTGACIHMEQTVSPVFFRKLVEVKRSL